MFMQVLHYIRSINQSINQSTQSCVKSFTKVANMTGNLEELTLKVLERDINVKKTKANEEKRLHYPANCQEINLEIIKSRLIPNLSITVLPFYPLTLLPLAQI